MAEKLDVKTKERITKEYFPDVAERLKMKLQLTQNFTAIVSGHGKSDTTYVVSI